MMSDFFDAVLPALVLALLPVVGTLAGPLYAPLAFALGTLRFVRRWAAERQAPRLDPAWLAVALAFSGLCWLSWFWSIAPQRTMHGALQVTVVLFAALLVLAQPGLAPATARRLLPAMAIAFAAGGIVLALDAAAGWPLQSWLSGAAANADTKYNRGVAYALLLAWPVFGRLWRERARGCAVCLLLGLGLMLGFGVGLTARLAAGTGLVVGGLALLLPRAIGPLLMLAASGFAAAAPLLLRALASGRLALAPYLKQSGEARLEIWDYMTARVVERPWLGHGFWSADRLPVSPAELSTYTWVSQQGVYPHDQWLQAWAELGALGAGLVAAASLLALFRVRRLEPQLQPFAYAAFAAALTLSAADFDLATDSWWAAIALSAWLFRPAPAAQHPREMTAA